MRPQEIYRLEWRYIGEVIIVLEIKNPYSRKRFTLKEGLDQKFTDFFVPLIKKIPMYDDANLKQILIPRFLRTARLSIEGWERYPQSTKKPANIDVDLISLYVAEYIPIENIDKLNKGLKKLYKKHSAPFQFDYMARIDGFCDEVKKSIHGGLWSNFGYLDFSKDKNLSEIIKEIHIHGTHVSSSSIILQFIITPSDSFTKEYKNVIDKDIRKGNVFDPTIKNFFKSWGTRGVPSTTVKEEMLEDFTLELKWRAMKEVSKYFDLYFTKNKLIPPSIEVYKINQLFCSYQGKEHKNNNHFWRSLGMSDFHFHEISSDGYWQLFHNRRDRLIDNSLKITCNSKIKREPGYHSLDFQITYFLEEFAENLLPILVMQKYVNNLSEIISVQQKDTFSSIKKAKPSYRRLIDIRYDLEQSLHILKRFKNEIDEKYFDRAKRTIINLTDFEPARPNLNRINKVWTEFIIDNTKYLIDKTYNHSQSFAQIIDDTVKLLEIKTNNSLRKFTFTLTVTTVILSLTATTVALISLYLQLDESSKKSLNELLNAARNLFF